VPFCYQSKLSGIGETAFHDVVWYARVIEYAPAGDERLSQLDRSWSIEFAEQGVRSYQRFS